MNKFGLVLGLAALLMLGACETMRTPANTSGTGTAYPQAAGSSGIYPGYGEVHSIDPVALVDAGVGDAAPNIGTNGYAGHALDKRNQQQTNVHKLTIRMDYGPYQTITQSSGADFRVGDRVQIDNGIARRY